MTGLALQVKDVRVSYGPKRAVDGVSLDINEGEIFGLLGPNGAGKTSTLSAIEGLLKPALTEIFRALLEADFTVQLRNNRALLVSFALPLVVLFALFASKFYSALGDRQFKVAAAMTLGMASIAILGYSMTWREIGKRESSSAYA